MVGKRCRQSCEKEVAAQEPQSSATRFNTYGDNGEELW
uniref:Uncharacterized protein n=1 Tax=Solanum lycopersicum TaxID=4081 RepID=A0A3Q7I120_SOLLC